MDPIEGDGKLRIHPGDLLLSALVTISALTLTLRWLAGWYLGARIEYLVPAQPAGRVRVTVIVPARDEAHALPRLLASLLAQDLPPDEVIVVDDHSIDGTAELARAAGVDVIDGAELPAGWTGKTWACAQGAAHAAGDLFVFLDADTSCSPGWLAALVAAHERRGGLVSVQPYHHMERPYEQLSACFNIVAFMGIGASLLQQRARVTGAFGPCLAISRVDYDAIGGHAAVGGAILEDLALAQRMRAIDRPVAALAGGTLISFRMYPLGLRQLGEGWSKNIAAGAGSTPLPRLLGIVAWVSGLIEAGWWTWAGLATLPFGSRLSVVHLVFYGLYAVQLWVLLRRLGNFGVSVLVFPVAAAAFVVIFFRSLFLTARGEVRWKGRRVSTRARAGT